MEGRYREVYRGHEIVVCRPPDHRATSRKWIWLDDRRGEGHAFNSRQEALLFARRRIDIVLSNTVAFIWSIKDECYLGVSQSANQGDFCNDISARLSSYGTPHAFPTEEKARRTLEEEAPWYNSGPDWPMREDYNLDNCRVVVVELNPQPK